MKLLLKPFFTYYGAKYRSAPGYPAPVHRILIEPFAGAAGYSLRHPGHAVLLADLDPILAGVWRYIVHAPEREIRALPVEFDGSVDTLTSIPQEARWLIGFWLNKGNTHPCKTPSAWMRAGTHNTSYWGPEIRERIASQQRYVRHWQVIETSYVNLPNVTATWFIDPPYNSSAGRLYRYHEIDYDQLAAWCRERKGQVIVCEQENATWLPFRYLLSAKTTEGKNHSGPSREAIWTNG